MRVYLSHDWKLIEGIFTLTVLDVHWGAGAVGLVVLNFCIELEF
jgi:hypothetical protein